ncbi:ROK family protein [soil metagenome]
MTTIGVDIGGTRIKGVVINADGEILHQLYLPTNDADGDTWKKGVADAVNELVNKSPAKDLLVGISAPGLPDDKNEAIAFMPGRLQGLENFNWTTFLDHRTYVVNDAIAALMAEAKLGAAKNSTNAVLLTLGTGVGGALLINGKPYQGSFNKAGHIGHSVVDCNGDADVTNMPGSLEECIGNCTIEKRSKGKFTSTHDLLIAYRNDDAFAKEIWFTSLKHLAIALASVCNIISPDTIVIGGGIAEANDDLFVPLNKMIDDYEWQPGGIKAQIVKAQQGDLAGAIGAACFAMEKFKEEKK